jgi:peptide deformylase
MQGVVVSVERAVRARLQALDASGEPVELELEGLPARVAQHELDHLDGVLILDRTTDEDRREALALLRQAAAL